MLDVLGKPLAKGSIPEELVRRITDAIIDGDLKPGDKIPTETEFSEHLGIGRNSVREATKILVFLGVLEIRRSEGTFVADGFNNKMLNPMIYGLIMEQKSMLELLELKLAMLRSILYLAVEKATPERIARLRKSYQEFEELVSREHCEDPAILYELSNGFHRVLGEICCNPLVTQLNTIVLKLAKFSRSKGVQRAVENHQPHRLVEACGTLLRVVEDRDKTLIEPALEQLFQYWRELLL